MPRQPPSPRSSDIERSIKERILGEARVDEQVAAAMRKMAAPDGEHFQHQVAERLTGDPEPHWTDCLTDFGRELAAALRHEALIPMGVRHALYRTGRWRPSHLGMTIQLILRHSTR